MLGPILLLAMALACGSQGGGERPASGVRIEAREAGVDSPLPCRVHLFGPDGKPRRAAGLPFWRNHFTCPGTVTVDLAPGKFTYEIERGPEYTSREGSFTVRNGRRTRVAVTLERIADLAAAGWWSGDLHVHRPLADIELLMRAEDLHVAPVITWWNRRNPWANQLPDQRLVRFDGNRYYDKMAGEDERGGGALLYFHLPRPLRIQAAAREHPSAIEFLELARKTPGVWVDAEKPFWWDVPTWIATGGVDSIGLANNHMCRSQMFESEAWGKSRDTVRLPPPKGTGYWSQEIYYRLLEAGIRLPPSAGSASGVLPNPLGYNRVYVHVGPEMTYESWWEGLRRGRSFVTNGPLLRVRANGELPGHVFAATGERTVAIELTLDLRGRDRHGVIEVIQNGQLVGTRRFESLPERRPLPPLEFSASGWFLVRVLADNDKTFRFASTAPFHVEVAAKPRISRRAAQSFLDWVGERKRRIQLDEAEQLRSVLTYHDRAERFWRKRVASATVD